MRAYFEKLRTTVRQNGLINDPAIDRSFQISKGFRLARQLLCGLDTFGIQVGSELLILFPRNSSMIPFPFRGAQSAPAPLNPSFTANVSFQIGFKNGTNGGMAVAVDAMSSISHPHAFKGVTDQGIAAVVEARGNQDVCGAKSPNFTVGHVCELADTIVKARPQHHPSIMIDRVHS